MKKKKEIVVKSNNLIQARYKLSLQEQHVVFWLLSQIQPEDEDFKNHKLKISEFADRLGVSADNQYSKLRAVTKRLMKRVMEIYSPERNKYIQVSWLSGAEYECNEGYATLRFDPALKPYLLQLKGCFTKLNLSEVLGFKSIYSIRIFELLLQRKEIGDRTISIDELRAYCQDENSKVYQLYSNLKQRVIDRAKNEINQKTDFEVDYKEIKESRKVVKLYWTIKKKDLLDKAEEENGYIVEKEYRSHKAILHAVEECGFSTKEAKDFLQNHSQQTVMDSLKSLARRVAKDPTIDPRTVLQEEINDRKKLWLKQRKT